jgi:hypothetical protein
MPRSKHRKKPARIKPAGRRASPLVIPADEQKMSEVLRKFIEPYVELTHDDDSLEWLIAVGAMAWNLALLPEEEREKTLDEIAREIFRKKWRSRLSNWLLNAIGSDHGVKDEPEPEEAQEFKVFMLGLVHRKLRYFGRNRRYILNFTAKVYEDGIDLTVMSTLEKVEMKRRG